jgi:hypothetical protein
VPAGLLASPGEFLLTALAALLLLVLVLRPYLRPEEGRDDEAAPAAGERPGGLLLRGFALLAPLGGVLVAWSFLRWIDAHASPALLAAEGLAARPPLPSSRDRWTPASSCGARRPPAARTRCACWSANCRAEDYHALGTLGAAPAEGRAAGPVTATAGLVARLLAASQRLFLHLVILFALLVLDLLFSRVAPVRRWLPPLLGPQGFGFQHKLLIAFLAVALLPVLLTGLFAGRQLSAEQDQASLRASLDRVQAARRSLENRVRQEARDLAASEYVRNFVVPDFPTTVRDIGSLEHNRLMIFNGAGDLLLDESLRNWSPAQVDSFLAVVPPGRVVYEREGRHVHAGILQPMELWHRERRVAFTVYYRLHVDAALLDGLGDVVGGELNLYIAGSLLYAERPELFGLGYQSQCSTWYRARPADGRAAPQQDLARAAGLRLAGRRCRSRTRQPCFRAWMSPASRRPPPDSARTSRLWSA